MLCALLLSEIGASTAVAGAAVALYPPTPGDVASSTFVLNAGGTPVPVVKFGDLSYARFVLTGSTIVDIATAGHRVREARVSPLNSKLDLRCKGENISFRLDRAGTCFVRIDDLETLLIFADEPESAAPKRADPGVIDLADYVPAGRDPTVPVTARIQKAIDDTAALAGGAGGVLYVSDGRYMAGQLRLRSNVHVYLSAGALLQSQVDFNATDFPPQANGDSSFIFIGDAHNVRISGRGVIDGDGHAVRSRDAKANIKLLRTAGASDVVIQDVFFRDSARWSLHLLDSDRLALRNFKLVNDLRGGLDPTEKVHIAVVTNTDGVDIDASRDVLIEGAFIYTADDAITPKVTNYMNRQGECRHLIVRNNVLWTLKAALKVGDETIQDLHDITFANNYVIHADRAIALWGGDGGHIHDIKITSNVVESIGGDYNERFFMFRVRLRRPGLSKPAPIEDVLVKDFYALAPAPQPSSFEALGEEGGIAGITFSNIQIGGRRARSIADIPLRLKGGAEAPVFGENR